MSSTRSRLVSFLLLVTLVLVPRSGWSLSFAEARDAIAQLERTNTVDLDRQEPILEQLEQWSTQFYSRVDRGQESRARSLFKVLHPLLKNLYDHNESYTERLTQETIRKDGDLEATQDRPDFRNADIARLRSLYHLNWVSYLGATLLPRSDSRRDDMFRFAAQHFGEFVVGPDEAIARESLLGRAQSYRGLGKTDEALQDFRRLVDMGPQIPQYAEARSSIPETLLEAGRADAAAREAEAVIADAASGSLPARQATKARLVKAQALLLELKKNRVPQGQRRDQLRRALSILRRVERQGGSWRKQARAVASWGLEGLPEADVAEGTGFAGIAVAQALIAKGAYQEALDKLEQTLADTSTPASTEAEAHFYAGIAAFQIDQHAAAARHLQQYLERSPGGRDAAEAAYLHFKALEKIAELRPSPEAQKAYRASLRNFVENHPDHSANGEARFRLAEILRDEGQVLDAVEQFRSVEGNETLEVYARFNAAQAMFDWLRDPPVDVPPEELRRKRTNTVESLASLASELQEETDGSTNGGGRFREIAAKSTLMAAMTAIRGDEPEYGKALALVENFPKRFPDRRKLARQAFAIEVLAHQKSGDPEGARTAIDAYLSAIAGSSTEQRRLLKRLGREFFAQSEAERGKGRDELAAASTRIAIAIYDRLRKELESAEASVHARRGVEAMLARLHESVGHAAEATTHYTELLRLDPKAPEALRGLARIASRSGEHEKAAKYWKSYANTLEPGDAEWFDARFTAVREAGAFGDSRAACETLRGTQDESPFPLTGREKATFRKLEKAHCTRS